MIVLLFVAVIASVIADLITLLPTVTMPDTSQAAVTLHSAFGYAAQLDNWFPLGTTAIAAGFVLVGWVASMAIRVMRISASFITGGGGGAG